MLCYIISYHIMLYYSILHMHIYIYIYTHTYAYIHIHIHMHTVGGIYVATLDA